MWSSVYAFTPRCSPTRAHGNGVRTTTAADRFGAPLGLVVVPFLLVAVIVLNALPETNHAVLEDISY
ncbi:hypothetical protein [Specibacter cremeus]|uniref:hypothetical protein n=1 Tax=Specibacter cremeus TaxID=1629051 RepID=UPI000F78E7E8|nr:hypothetical protein [Specibacter cremeus]